MHFILALDPPLAQHRKVSFSFRNKAEMCVVEGTLLIVFLAITRSSEKGDLGVLPTEPELNQRSLYCRQFLH